MKITAPRVGHLWVALRTFFDKTGLPAVEPPPLSRRTVSLGVRYSPEWMCFPFKTVLGSFIEAIELGADTVVMAAGPNLCRLGYFARLEEQIIHDAGYPHVQVLTFNWQEEGGIVGLARFLRRILGEDASWREIAGLIKHGIQQVALMEELERRVHYLRPRVEDLAALNRIWRGAGDRVSAAHTGEELKHARHELFSEVNALPLKPNVDPLRVAIQGEFIMVLDPFHNMDIEDELGKRGVEVHRSTWIAEWVKIWLFLELIGLGHGEQVKKAARPYLRRDVSGEAVRSLGETVLHAREGFDGVIHIQPFTCMPEITAQNIMPQVTRDHNIPVLPILMDEQMARAGFITRLEAFVDLMERRRRIKHKT